MLSQGGALSKPECLTISGTRMDTWFLTVGDFIPQGHVYCHPAYITSMQSTSWETLGWKKHKLQSRLLGEVSIISDMQMTPPLLQKWRGTKKPLDESERGEWKSWLKAQHSEKEDHGIRSHHSMRNRWRNSGNSGWLFCGAPKSLQMVTAAMKLKDANSLEEKLWPT